MILYGLWVVVLMPLPGWIQHQFGLEIIETTAPLVTPRPLHEPLLGQWMIEASYDRITPKTNETTRREGTVGQMMIVLTIALEQSRNSSNSKVRSSP
ncbi:MAG TPA: hypothetical protein V6C84_17425 [Coleofasciculaceae cyanobacterium]|jgi:hypothetical protein